MKADFNRLLSGFLIASAGLFLLDQACSELTAGMVESRESQRNGGEENSRDARLQRLEALCQQELVQAHLERMGLSREDAMARLARLCDADLQELTERMDQVLAGGQDTYGDKPLYQRIGFWILWAVVIALIIFTFAAIGGNVT